MCYYVIQSSFHLWSNLCFIALLLTSQTSVHYCATGIAQVLHMLWVSMVFNIFPSIESLSSPQTGDINHHSLSLSLKSLSPLLMGLPSFHSWMQRTHQLACIFSLLLLWVSILIFCSVLNNCPIHRLSTRLSPFIEVHSRSHHSSQMRTHGALSTTFATVFFALTLSAGIGSWAHLSSQRSLVASRTDSTMENCVRFQLTKVTWWVSWARQKVQVL